jgi:CheY-like chemotaxis protein
MLMSQSPARVLLVDSNRDGLDLYATALAFEGIPSDVVDSAREALYRVAADPPRVFVTGLRLRDVRATELIRQVRDTTGRQELLIVGLTANVQLDSQRAHEAGCDIVLPVPCLPATLVHEVRRVL